jgi:hypothetical protein
MLSELKKGACIAKALQKKAVVIKHAALAIVREAHDLSKEERSASDLEGEAEKLAKELAESWKKAEKLPEKDFDAQAKLDRKINELNDKHAMHINKRSEIINSYLKKVYTPRCAKELTHLLIDALPTSCLVQARNAFSRAIYEKSLRDRKLTVQQLKKIEIDLKKIFI